MTKSPAKLVYVPILGISLPRENKPHLERVRQLPCSVTGEPADEAHHPRGLGWACGMGLKAPDETAIPLCRRIHDEYHRMGVKTWEARYGPHLDHLRKTLDQLKNRFETKD